MPPSKSPSKSRSKPESTPHNTSKSPTPALLTQPNRVTPEWLTSVLRHAGQEGTVEAFEAKSIGTGQIGENVRFSLQGSGVPASVVGKFASSDPTSKQTGMDLQNYIREVFFYETLSSTLDIQTPDVLFAKANNDNHDFVIVMEDLAPGEQGDQLQGCTVDQAALALEQLAKMQGPRWGDKELNHYPLLTNNLTAENSGGTQALYQTLEPGFLERYQSRLNTDQTKMCKQAGALLQHYNRLYQGPPVLIHIDYRLDNMMFGGPYPLAVVDWQSIALGCPLQDASYFLGTSLAPELRIKEEQQLLKHYLGVLRSYRVDLSFNECFRYYRNYAPAGLIMAVIASMLVGETPRGNDMFMAMATRSSQMCLELDWVKLMQQGQP